MIVPGREARAAPQGRGARSRMWLQRAPYGTGLVVNRVRVGIPRDRQGESREFLRGGGRYNALCSCIALRSH